MNDLSSLNTDDYQNRGIKYPKSGIPVCINATTNNAVFSFKNTSERTGERWVKNFCRQRGIKYSKISSWQDGDYHDDWIDVEIII